ncbi:MAG: putative signal transducing protein [Saprospiraceae bacterium]
MRRDDILDDSNFHNNGDFDESSCEIVAKYYSPMEADVAFARLSAEDIPCFLSNSTAHSVMPHLQLLICLYVRREDLERASIIIAEIAAETELTAEDPGIGRVSSIMFAVLIGLLLIAVLVLSFC